MFDIYACVIRLILKLEKQLQTRRVSAFYANYDVEIFKECKSNQNLNVQQANELKHFHLRMLVFQNWQSTVSPGFCSVDFLNVRTIGSSKF